MITHFCAYLAHATSPDVYLYLKADATKQAAATTWDKENHEAILEDNKILDCLMDESDKMDWLQDPNKHKGVQLLQDPVQVETDNSLSQSAFKFSQDTQSIGTFNQIG